MANETILIVDADITSQKVLEVSFKKAGHRVIITDSIADAHEHIAKTPPSLIIADTELPDGDGLEFCADLKLEEGTKDIPLIFVTEDRSVTQKMRSYELGADDYLTKPVYIKELITRAELLLQRRAREVLARGDVEEFQGDLEEITMIDLLPQIIEEERSGSVRIYKEGREGVFYFHQGRILDGICGKLQGEEAIYRMMRWSRGYFVVRYDETLGRTMHIDRDSSELFIEGIRRFEQWNELRQGLPDFDQILATDYEGQPALLSALPPEVERIVRLFDGYRRLHEVIDDSPIEDLKTLQIVHKLLEDELLLNVTDESGPIADEAEGPAPSLDDWLASEIDGAKTGASDEESASGPVAVERFFKPVVDPDEVDTDEISRSPLEPLSDRLGEGGGHWKFHWGDSEASADDEEEGLDEDSLVDEEDGELIQSEGLRELEEQERLRREEEARRLAEQREKFDQEQEAERRERTITPIFTPARVLGEAALEDDIAQEEKSDAREDESPGQPPKGEKAGMMFASGDDVFGEDEQPVAALDKTDEWIAFRDEDEDGESGEDDAGESEEDLESGEADEWAESEEIEESEEPGEEGEAEAEESEELGEEGEAEAEESEEPEEGEVADEEEVEAEADSEEDDQYEVDTAEFALTELYPEFDPEFREETEEEPPPPEEVDQPAVFQITRNAVDNQIVFAEFDLGPRATAPVATEDAGSEQDEEEAGARDEDASLEPPLDGDQDSNTGEDDAEAIDQGESKEAQEDEESLEAAGDGGEPEEVGGAAGIRPGADEDESSKPVLDDDLAAALEGGTNNWRGWVVFAAIAALVAVLLALFSLRGERPMASEPGAIAEAPVVEEPLPEEPVVDEEGAEEPVAVQEEEPPPAGLDRQEAGFEAQFEGASVELTARNMAQQLQAAHPELEEQAEEPEPAQELEPAAEPEQAAPAQVEQVQREEPQAASPAQPTSPAQPAQEERTVAQEIQYVRTLIDRDRIDEALAAAQRLTERAPNNAQAAFLRGQAALNAEKYPEALEQLTRAEQLGLGSGELYLELGTVYQVLGRRDDARRAYENFLKIQPTGRTADDVRAILERQF